jgi:hypothetical protein
MLSLDEQWYLSGADLVFEYPDTWVRLQGLSDPSRGPNRERGR